MTWISVLLFHSFKNKDRIEKKYKIKYMYITKCQNDMVYDTKKKRGHLKSINVKRLIIVCPLSILPLLLV